MSRTPSGAIHDPDLDTPHRPPAFGAESVAEAQRLVANPSLAFLAWLMAYLVIRHALIGHHLVLFFAGLFMAIVPMTLGQYHCLDCGATGWALRARRHACPSVLWRLYHPDGSWLRIPRLRTQFKLWGCLVIVSSLFYAILAVSRH